MEWCQKLWKYNLYYTRIILYLPATLHKACLSPVIVILLTLALGVASLVVPLFWAFLAPGLLDHWAGRDPCPASPQLPLPLLRYVNPFQPLPPNPSCPIFSIRDWGLRLMVRQSITPPQMGWFIVPPFHLGRAEAPGGPAWRALGIFAVSDLTAPGSQSTLMPSTKRPLQNGRHPSYRQPGICLKEQKHREKKQWGSLLFSLASSHRHWSPLQQFIISPLLWLPSWGWWVTPPCFCLTVGAITVNIATSLATESKIVSVLYWQHMDAFCFILTDLCACAALRQCCSCCIYTMIISGM